MKLISALSFALIFYCFTPNLLAQNSKKLVSVPVAVSDKEGHYISGLKKEDFSIFQNGVRQEIVSFETEDEPVSVAILIDTSRSTDKIISKIKDAAKEFLKTLNPKDLCMIATFDSEVNILSQFSADQQALEKAIDNIQTSQKVGSVLHRAISRITQTSFAPVQGRKAVIILSDGKDFGSYLTRNELIEQLQESDVMVYTVYYKTGIDFGKENSSPNVQNIAEVKKPKAKKKKQNGFSLDIPDGDFPSEEEVKAREKQEDQEAIDALKKMSDTTAGRFYQRDVMDLKGTFQQIADELRKQYRLSYYTIAAPGKTTAPIDFQIKVSRSDAVVRTREGLKLK